MRICRFDRGSEKDRLGVVEGDKVYDVTAAIDAKLGWNRLRSDSSFAGFGNGTFRRNQQSIRVGLDVPITSTANGFLPQAGDLSASFEYERAHYSDIGSVNHWTYGLTWEPRPLLRLHGAINRTSVPAPIQTIGNPVIVTPQVRVFDALIEVGAVIGSVLSRVSVAGVQRASRSSRAVRITAALARSWASSSPSSGSGNVAATPAPPTSRGSETVTSGTPATSAAGVQTVRTDRWSWMTASTTRARALPTP